VHNQEKSPEQVVSILHTLHIRTAKTPQSPSESTFLQLFQSELKDAESWLCRYSAHQDLFFLNQAFAVYCNVYRFPLKPGASRPSSRR